MAEQTIFVRLGQRRVKEKLIYPLCLQVPNLFNTCLNWASDGKAMRIWPASMPQ